MLKLNNILVNELRELGELLADTTKESREPVLYGFGIKEKSAENILASCVHDLAEELGAELQGVFYGGFLTSYWALYTVEGGYFFKPFEDLAECENCGFIEDTEFMFETEDGGWICDDCRNDYYYCDHCGKYSTETFTVKGSRYDEYWCQSCIDSVDYLYQCQECGEYFPSEYGIYDNYGTQICDDCYSDNFCTCEDCGRIIPSDSAYFSGDSIYCENCAPVVDYCDPYFYDIRSDKKAVSFGVEIECGTDSRSPQDSFNYFYATYDSSISGYRTPIEWVSDIFCLDDIMGGGRICDELEDIEENFRANSSCGLHVHAGRGFFKPLSVCKARLFIHNNYCQLVRFCRRSLDDAKHWAEDGIQSRYNKGETLAEKLQYYTRNRYEALNVTNTDTVELRLFAGSTKKTDVQAAVSFYAALIEYCNNNNFVAVNRATIADIINSFSNAEAAELLKVYYYSRM